MRPRNTILRNIFGLALLIGSLLTVAPLNANDRVYARAVRSTVLIDTPKAFGAGVLIDAGERLVVTANHVVTKDKEVNIFFVAFDGESRPITNLKHYLSNRERLAIRGTVIARVERCDLALIRLAAVPEGALAMPIPSQNTRLGQRVHVIGHSSILRGAVFNYSGGGQVRNIFDMKLNVKVVNVEGKPTTSFEGRVAETTVVSREGDSGGPVVNDAAQLVGIISASIGGPAKEKDKDLEDVKVNMSIDVSEVKALLRAGGFAVPASTPLVKAKPKQDTTEREDAAPTVPKTPSLVGLWKGPATDTNGGKFTYQFAADGNFRIAKVDEEGVSRDPVRGRYELADNKLTFKIDGKVKMQVLIQFVDANHLSVRREGGEAVTWQR